MDQAPAGRDIIVIGASPGGIEALTALVRVLPAALPAALLVVVHEPPEAPGVLPGVLNRAGALLCLQPTDDTGIQDGRIYVAPPDLHMLVREGRIVLRRGPRENGQRPAVDPLFRSAALCYGPRVVGVLLGGALDDGAAGLWAVRQRGGLAVVQEPRGSLYPEMPRNAQLRVEVDHCLEVGDICRLLVAVAGPVRQAQGRPEEEPQVVPLPAASWRGLTGGFGGGRWAPSAFSCPACDGVLWEAEEGRLLRFSCGIGHRFSPESMLAAQGDALERGLCGALRLFEERARLNQRLAEQAALRGLHGAQARYARTAREAERGAALLRGLAPAGE